MTALAASTPLSRSLKLMSETEFLEWSSRLEDSRAEWVDGKVILMPPVELSHARIVHFLTRLLGDFVEQRDLGEVLGDPYQIRSAKMRRRRMPDVMFVSNANLQNLKRMELEGPPDLAVEVISPDSQTRDRREKFFEYLQMGVREYWIIDPMVKGMECYTLKRKEYMLMDIERGRIDSIVLQGLFIRPEWFWALRPPKVLGLLKQMNGR